MSNEVLFVPSLKADTGRFIHSAYEWVSSIVENEDDDKGDKLDTNKDFIFFKKGNSVDFTRPCGKLVAHRGFDALEYYLNSPETAHLHHRAAKKLMWHPSEQCLNRNDTIEVDGGTFAQFNVTCTGSSDVLLRAMVGTFSVDSPYMKHGRDSVFVKVEMLNDEGYIVDVKRDLAANDREHHYVSKGADLVMEDVEQKMRTCAASKSLLVQGVAGGGWRRLHLDRVNVKSKDEIAVNTSLLAYFEAFTFSYNQAVSKSHEVTRIFQDVLLETPSDEAVSYVAISASEDPYWQLKQADKNLHCDTGSARSNCLVPSFLHKAGIANLNSWTIPLPKYESAQTSLNLGLCLIVLVIVGLVYRKNRNRRAGYQSVSSV